jgi:hypothetical protein
MKRISITNLTAILAVIASGVIGCSGSPTTPGSEGALNLDAPYGGYEAAGEVPAFGQTDLAAVLVEGEVVEEPLIADAELDSLRERAGAHAYGLLIRWGMLEGDSTVSDVTDWSGTITLSRGVLAVQRLLRFERGQDYIVRPRPSRSELEWVSKMTVHFDGLLLTVVEPPVLAGTEVGDNLLTFATGPYNRVFNITAGDLNELQEIIEVDPEGNQIAFNARALEPHPCDGGPLHGFWVLDSAGTGGHFFGGWAARDGRPRGHLRGHFGIRDGEKVFFGKVIGQGGEFLGFFRGQWGFAEDTRRNGWFDGEWVADDGQPVGRMHGRWSDRPPPSDEDRSEPPFQGNNGEVRHPHNGSGFLGGWWNRICLRPADEPA